MIFKIILVLLAVFSLKTFAAEQKVQKKELKQLDHKQLQSIIKTSEKLQNKKNKTV